MPALLLLVLILVCLPLPARAMPPDVQAQMTAADDDPREAARQIQRRLSVAPATGGESTRFWWNIAAAWVMVTLERHGDAAQHAAAAASLLDPSASPTDARRLWLTLTQLDAKSGEADSASLLPQLTGLREQAERLGDMALTCHARNLEFWLLLDLRSDDEAWLAAEAMERCGRLMNSPEQAAAAQLSFAQLSRYRLADGVQAAQPEQHLSRALDELGTRPARFLRSVIEWEAGIVLRHQKQLEPALERLRRTRSLSQELGDRAGVAAANLEIAAVLLALDRPSQALPLLNEAPHLMAASSEGDAAYRMPRVMELKLHALSALRSPDTAAAIDQARPWVTNKPVSNSRAQLEEAMAQAYASIARPGQAYEMLRTSVQTHHQLRNASRDAQLQRLQARYDTAHRDAENAQLKLSSEAARLELLAEQGRQQTLTAGLVALGALSVLGFSFGGRELARRRRMAALALRDELTGQPNRRAVQAYAQEQLAQAQRLGLPFSLALIDLDHFKQVNDRFGHAAGDAVLRTFAQAGEAALRGQDRLGRWGGEEWLLVMPGTRLSEIDGVFERLREQFAQTALPGLPPEARCSFSMGAADRGSTDSASLDSIVAAADAALYRAKQAGRNRLLVAAPGTVG